MSKQCRLCAQFTESAIDLFLEHETTLLTKINSFLPITISNDKYLPRKICCKCVERSNATHSFIQEILLAQAVFGIPNNSPVKASTPANSVMYGGITISSTTKASIQVPAAKKQPIKKKSQNVSETLKKLKKLQSGMTISKTVIPALNQSNHSKAERKCKKERKFYGENDEDDGDFDKDDDYKDPTFDDANGNDYDSGGSSDGGSGSDGASDDDDDDFNNDDEDDNYEPSDKKRKITTKIPISNKSTASTISSNKQPSNNSDASTKFKSIKINAPPVFLCMKCKNKFETLADLKQHVFQKNACSTSQLTCKICEKKFETRKKLQQHSKSHIEKTKFICDKCGKMYTNQFNLENHKSAQHGEYVDESQNIYKCRICSTRFDNRTDLYSHMKTHTREKQEVLCDTCGKCFANSHNLKSHQKVHLDIRPFPCELCPKSFRTRLLLRQHLHVHTGIKEFQCVHCGQSFAKADSLRLHIRKRHPDLGPIDSAAKQVQPPENKPSIENSAADLSTNQPIDATMKSSVGGRTDEMPNKIEIDSNSNSSSN